MSVGKRIRRVREREKMSQRAFASAIGERQSIISKWELDKYRPPYEALRRICREFRVDEMWLRCGIGGVNGSSERPKKTAKVSREHCRGCYHFTDHREYSHCDYIGHVGCCRPCPAGKSCTEYITKENWRKRREKEKNNAE